MPKGILEMYSGGCGCEAIRFEISGEPINAAVCHCNQCKKATGAPMFMAPAFYDKDIRMIRGEPKWYRSSEKASRGFCSDCGSPLFFKFENSIALDVLIGSLDDPDQIAPTEHLWTEKKVSWLSIDESLPCYAQDRAKKLF
jgi:hypothetical protein